MGLAFEFLNLNFSFLPLIFLVEVLRIMIFSFRYSSLEGLGGWWDARVAALREREPLFALLCFALLALISPVVLSSNHV